MYSWFEIQKVADLIIKISQLLQKGQLTMMFFGWKLFPLHQPRFRKKKTDCRTSIDWRQHVWIHLAPFQDVFFWATGLSVFLLGFFLKKLPSCLEKKQHNPPKIGRRTSSSFGGEHVSLAVRGEEHPRILFCLLRFGWRRVTMEWYPEKWRSLKPRKRSVTGPNEVTLKKLAFIVHCVVSVAYNALVFKKYNMGFSIPLRQGCQGSQPGSLLGSDPETNHATAISKYSTLPLTPNMNSTNNCQKKPTESIHFLLVSSLVPCIQPHFSACDLAFLWQSTIVIFPSPWNFQDRVQGFDSTFQEASNCYDEVNLPYPTPPGVTCPPPPN